MKRGDTVVLNKFEVKEEESKVVERQQTQKPLVVQMTHKGISLVVPKVGPNQKNGNILD